MARKQPIILKMDLGPNGIHSFKTLEEIEAWLQSERNFWGWLGGQAGQQPVHQLWQNYNQLWNSITQSINNARQRVDQPDFQNYINQIDSYCQPTYHNNSLLHSSSPTAIFLDNLKKEKPLVAACAACYLLGLGINPQLPHSIEGAFEALKFREGITSNIDTERQRLEELSKSFYDVREGYQNDLNELQNEFETIAKAIESARSEQQSKFDKLVEDSESKLKDIQETYDKKLSLQSSVTYWKDKYKRHLIFSCVFAIVATLSALLGLYFIRLQFNEVLKQTVEATVQNTKAEYLRIGMVIIVATFVLWFVRIIVRILLSHLHLGSDANERVTMIQTYLALLREGNSLQENEKQLILQTLFRPSADGIVKDDGAPPSIPEAISRLGIGGKG